MSKKEELFCEECGADFTNGEECKCHIVAAELDPAREPDAIELLISVAKKALKAIDAANEEAEGPMAMPVPEAEELREAVYNLEDIMALIPYETLAMFRMEMIAADFNARTMRQDGIEDLHAFHNKLADEVVALQRGFIEEDGKPVDPCLLDEAINDDGMIGAANPAMLEKFTAESKEDLATRNLKFFLRHDAPVEEKERVGMTLREVIERYNPDVQVRCPFVDECTEVDFGEYKTCPHSDYHRISVDCLEVCMYIDSPYGRGRPCKPMEDSDEEAIE